MLKTDENGMVVLNGHKLKINGKDIKTVLSNAIVK